MRCRFLAGRMILCLRRTGNETALPVNGVPSNRCPGPVRGSAMVAETAKNKICRLVAILCSWGKRNFIGCTGLVCHVSLAGAALIAAVWLSEMLWPAWPGKVLFFLGCLAILEAALWIAARVLRLILKAGSRWGPATAALAAAIWFMADRGTSNPEWQVAIFTVAAVGVLQGAALGIAALWHRRWTPTVLGTFLCFGALTVLLGIFLFTEGFDGQVIERYLRASGLPAASDAAASDGPYTVKIVDYGTEGGLPSGTVNLTRYMSRESLDGLSDLQVDLYVDYDLNAVPLVGRIWYPEGAENCPVLFIAHGNHVVTVDSYLGYEYLGEYLASWGYVVVSVDHNACNMLSGENDGRAVLLLEHIGQVLAYNEKELPGLIDPERIALAGHSRGGETVATAALFNTYDRYPENGTIRFDYHYAIRSLIAIAPTEGQYEPGDHSVELVDMNYLLLYGSNDQDVTNFQGMNQYENIHFSGEGDYIKSALWIAGANHGQFNSLWQDEDQLAPAGWMLNTGDFLTMEEQQTIAKRMIRAFLDVTLREDRTELGLLTNWRSYAGELPATVYSQCYETSAFQVLANFEEDSNMETGSGAGVSLQAEHVSLWTEELATYHDGGELDNYAVRLRSFSDTGTYTLSLPETDLAGLALQFDISDYDSDSVERGRYELLDCIVEITDAAGGTAQARLSDFAAVYPPFPVRLSKLDCLFDVERFQYNFSTVRIPASAFEGEADLSAVVQIAFRLDGPSHIRLDNIGLAGCE